MAPVLIIGGGISGLCLAQGLQKLSIDFKVFERDTSTDARQQGYRVRIHEGAQSIKNVLSPHVVPLFSQSCACGGGMGGKFDALSLEFMPPPAQFTKMSGPGGGPVPTTVDRRFLRDVLMTDIADKVVFGKAFSHYELDSEGVTAHFADGSSERGRLLVGADGKHSRVTKQYIPDHVLLDTEGRLFYGKTPVTPSIDEVLQQRDWATGATLFQDTQSLQTPLVLFMEKVAWDPEARAALSEQHKIDAPQDYVYWVLATRESSLPGEFISSRLRQDNRSAADAVVRLTVNWADDLRTLLQGQDPEQTALFHVTSVHPNMKPWTPSRFVTVMG
jgi:hypothetical protein